MAIVYYTQQNEYDLVHSGQDCIGWTVVDQSGKELGKVTEMLINTDSETVDSILIDRRKRVPAADFALADGRVIARGVFDDPGQESVQTTTETAETETYNTAAQSTNAHHVAGLTRAANENETVIPIVEEQLRVGKRTVEGGAVRINTGVVETPVEAQVNLREEHVRVERHAVDRPASEADFQTFKEGEIELTERAEVAVVAKEARVVEEIAVGKEVTERTETVRDTVRRTEVDVDETDEETLRRNANR